MSVEFEWDEKKNQANIKKHGISFQQAQAIFSGPVLSRIDDRFNYGEVRVISVGRFGTAAVVVVVHTVRGGAIRIISARPANRKARERYEEEIRKALDD